MKKRILFISTIPLSLKAFSLDFMKFLRKEGYEVEALAGDGQEAEVIEKEGFKYHRVSMPRSLDPKGDFMALKSMKDLFQRERFDLVHTQTAKAGFIGRMALKNTKTPLVVHTAHNWPFHSLLPLPAKYFYLGLEKIAAKWCDAIVVDTEAVREYGLENKVAPAEKIFQIYMGIDLDKFRSYDLDKKADMRKSLGIGSDKIVIGAIARLVPDKGIETFLACAEKLKDNESLVFVLVGDGELRPRFEKEVQDIGMKDKFIFTGHLDDVVPCLNVFDVFCLPTLREGFGVVFAEAGACGVPAVASEIGPLKEVVENGFSGFLVQQDQPQAFADAIKKLFDIELRGKMGEQARRYVQAKFDIENINVQTLDLYRRLWKDKFHDDF